MPTLYGPLSYSMRRTGAATVSFEIGGPIPARVVLRPPLGAALRTVLVDGLECANFDADSVTLPHTPARLVLGT
jgi:hypothetical protein